MVLSESGVYSPNEDFVGGGGYGVVEARGICPIESSAKKSVAHALFAFSSVRGLVSPLFAAPVAPAAAATARASSVCAHRREHDGSRLFVRLGGGGLVELLLRCCRRRRTRTDATVVFALLYIAWEMVANQCNIRNDLYKAAALGRTST